MRESWIVCDYIIIIDLTNYTVKISKILNNRFSLTLDWCKFSKLSNWLQSISEYKVQYPETYCECGRCDIIRFIYLPNVNFFETSYHNDKTFLIDQSCRQTLLEIHSRIIRRRICITNSPTSCSA